MMDITGAMDFEEIVEVYGTFPLKDNFLDAGNDALEEYGVKGKIKDGVIKIPFVDRLLFNEDEYDFYGIDEDSEDMKRWRMRVAATIVPADNPAQGVTDAYVEYYVLIPGDEMNREFDEYYEPRQEEFDQAQGLIELFLNAAVDCG